MRKFKVIPVLDILNSKAVHGFKGERNKYKPLKSKLFNSSDPLKILKDLTYKYHFNEFYIADLDGILNKKPNLGLLNKILQITGINIIIDPGIANSDDIHQFSKLDIKKLIIGLETVRSLEEMKNAISIMGEERLIISIDMYKGKILAQAKELKDKAPIEIVKKIQKIGISEIILLDLFRVGQKMGGIPQSYLDIQKVFNGKIFVGGGIKDYKDILKYIKHNFTGILIATALYDGTIKIEKVRKIKG